MDERDSTAVFGRHAVEALLQAGRAVDTLWLAQGMDGRAAAHFTALGRAVGAVVKRAGPDKLDALADSGRHQGVVATVPAIAYAEVADMLAAARAAGEDPFLLLCDKIEDPHNLGALIRSALLCGAHGVVIPRRGAAAVTPVVMKASAGAAAALPVARMANLGEVIRRLKKDNLFVYCADMDGTPLPRQDLSGPVALVMGGEGRGVSPLVRKLCDGAVSLAMAPRAGVDSFNVSVAGGILLYEVFRRRHAAP